MNTLGVDIYIYRKLPEGRIEVLHSGDVTTVADLGAHLKPSLSLNDDQFKLLIDAIHKDYKPSEGKYTEGKLEATERHLEDMRELIFTEHRLKNNRIILQKP